jgi:hypothetical protein
MHFKTTDALIKSAFAEADLDKILVDSIKKTIQKEDKNMEYLYEVFLVDSKRTIQLNEVTVAGNEEEAKFNAGVYDLLRDNGTKLSNVTIIVNRLGSVKVEY